MVKVTLRSVTRTCIVVTTVTIFEAFTVFAYFWVILWSNYYRVPVHRGCRYSSIAIRSGVSWRKAVRPSSHGHVCFCCLQHSAKDVSSHKNVSLPGYVWCSEWNRLVSVSVDVLNGFKILGIMILYYFGVAVWRWRAVKLVSSWVRAYSWWNMAHSLINYWVDSEFSGNCAYSNIQIISPFL
jgi:hypothetical protein